MDTASRNTSEAARLKMYRANDFETTRQKIIGVAGSRCKMEASSGGHLHTVFAGTRKVPDD